MRTLVRSVGKASIGGEPLPSCFKAFEANKIIIRRSEVSMFAGAPGAGKSTLTSYLIDNLPKDFGLEVTPRFTSATEVRDKLKNEDFAALKKLLPKPVLNLYTLLSAEIPKS